MFVPTSEVCALRKTACVLTFLVAALPALAQPSFPTLDMRVERCTCRYAELIQRLERAIEANSMRLVARASASVGAAERGVTIPGNAVLMVFRNDFAVRMLAANVAAGIEAPIRYYVTENGDGTATLSWRSPSAVFAPFRGADLAALARELDPIFAKIAADALRQ
jgi:uncharacterized protein (DUF302 family)